MIVPGSLKIFLLDASRCAILFSGGADSEVLLRAAVDVLNPQNVVSLTADSPFLAGFYRNSIQRVAAEIRIESIFVNVNLLDNPIFRKNTPERCYICKREIFRKLREKARSLGYAVVMDGTNTDDQEEYRPGLAAAREYGIIHPFLEAGMGKADIGRMAAALAACGTEKPSDSCLATRIVEGHSITLELVELVEKMEAPLRPLVQGRFRVRTDGSKLTVRFSKIDSDVVDKHREELISIANMAGLACKFCQI